MINYFDNQNTINYVVSKSIDKSKVNFLHDSFYKNDSIRKRSIANIKNNNMYDECLKNWHIFFQKLKYGHYLNKYGLGETKNLDGLKTLDGNKELQKEDDEYYKIWAISKSQGYDMENLSLLIMMIMNHIINGDVV